MLELKHITKRGTLVYKDGSEIELETIITKAMAKADSQSKANLVSFLRQQLDSIEQQG